MHTMIHHLPRLATVAPLLALAIYLFDLTLSSAAPSQPPRPNFLFILVDDLGYTDVGYNGSTFYETPNIDKLATQGMVFTDGYAPAPLCSATRAGIMSGQ